MKYLIISLENTKGKAYQELRARYSVIDFNKNLHLLKNINDIGKSDIVVVNAQTSILGKKDIIWSYLGQQNLQGWDVVFIYKSSRHRNLYHNYRYALRKLPSLNGEEFGHEFLHRASEDDRSFVSMSESSDEESGVPVYKLHLDALEQIIKKLMDEKPQKKRESLPNRRRSLSRAGARRGSLIKEAKMKPIPASPQAVKKGIISDLVQASASVIVSAMADEARSAFQSPKKTEKTSIRHKSTCIEVVQGSKILKSFPFSNKLSKKKASISAKRFLRSL
jgi:hypothetical protein